MTTPTGQISFSDIQDEFGVPPGKNLGAYRVNESIAGRNWPLDTGVPTSGPIRFSDLQGKILNTVVDYSGGTTNRNEEYTVNFSASRDADNTLTATFTPQDPKPPGALPFSINAPNGTVSRPRDVFVGVNYLVTSNAPRRRISLSGRRLDLDDGPIDYNDLQVTAPLNGGGIFYQIGSNFYYIKDPDFTESNLNSQTQYDSSSIIVGGFRSRPSSSSNGTKKVYNVIRGSVGGTRALAKPSLITGTGWGSGTQLFYNITGSGAVYGGYGGEGSHAFGASRNCDMIIDPGGQLIGGPPSSAAIIRSSEEVIVSLTNNGTVTGSTTLVGVF